MKCGPCRRCLERVVMIGSSPLQGDSTVRKIQTSRDYGSSMPWAVWFMTCGIIVWSYITVPIKGIFQKCGPDEDGPGLKTTAGGQGCCQKSKVSPPREFKSDGRTIPKPLVGDIWRRCSSTVRNILHQPVIKIIHWGDRQDSFNQEPNHWIDASIFTTILEKIIDGPRGIVVNCLSS